ncbi:MAG: RNA-directed DNA polymerase [Tenuifilaceae bacterium]|jgi:hypothetical protein|nr:RNA-directed DNA polymerase [Tenuifilaceae bacterium]
MGKLIEKIIRTENLYWAWNKVKNSFRVGDIWYDQIELSLFEACLYEELEKIIQDIISGTYVLYPIKPLPFPKGVDKENGSPRVRQTFEIHVRDQVTWTAIVNVIGESLDYKMPWWSYGHRLYVPVWKDIESNLWNIGWYRHSKGYLYRKWNQSWPLFRRNISLTAKIMCQQKKSNDTSFNNVELDEAEVNIYDSNTNLPKPFKSLYLNKDYWDNRSSDKLYWGTIDFSKFYSNIKLSTIRDNIIKYTESAAEDEEFKKLINNLLNFKIDVSEWDKKDLSKENGIDLDPQNFQGLPTGLFVAGFLANVALLGVDTKVTQELDKKRDVAHFRFVDDHVILAYDFDRLQQWIQTYETYLREANINVEFNFEKIEPKSLSNILNPKWLEKIGEEETEKEKIKAKKESTLDPAFPAPLMTQTLAKVSAISNSDFEFLSQNEEKQLISDLEHLLLTDFPDHELRKDTRVSFAVSILSRIVPNTKIDYTNVYECQKRIHQIIKAYHKKDRRLDKDFIADEIYDLLYDSTQCNSIESVEEYLSKWKPENNSQIDAIEAIKTEKKEELKLRKEIEDQRKKQKNHIYKLLIKAISENPEKVRIWTRVIDYCMKVGCCDVMTAYNKIEELKNNTIHILSATFLQTLFMNVLADRAMQTVSKIVNEKLLSQKEKEFAKHFIDNVFNEEFLNNILDNKRTEAKKEIKSYYVKTYNFYKFVLGSIIFILKGTSFKIKNDENLIKEYELIDWGSNAENWIEKTHITDINAWLYWLLWKTHEVSTSKPLDFWRELQCYINYENSTYKPLIIPFPNYEHLPKHDDEFFKFILSADFEEGWFLEVFKTKWGNVSEVIKETVKTKHQNLYNNLNQQDNSLWDYIQWQGKRLNNLPKEEICAFNVYFNPHFSEWTALEFVKQIAELSNDTVDDFFKQKSKKKDMQYHPANFIIKKTVFDNEDKIPTWHEWKEKMRSIPKISIVEKKSQICDNRYTTIGLLSKQSNGEQAKVHALGIILLQLLTHNTNFPWIWNSKDKSMIWGNLIYKKIQDISISSCTLLILQSCFSSKNRETFTNSEKFEKFYKENDYNRKDTFMDAPLIPDISTLVDYIDKAQRIVERYQLSMENNVPRQLIPISLIQLSNQNNPFEDSNYIE